MPRGSMSVGKVLDRECLFNVEERVHSKGTKSLVSMYETGHNRRSLSNMRTLTKQFRGFWITITALSVYPCFYFFHLYMS